MRPSGFLSPWRSTARHVADPGDTAPRSGPPRFAQRRFGEALGDLRAAGEIATGGLTGSPCYLSWRSEAALAALALGERDTARRLSDEELELARAFGAPRALGVALRAAGLVAGGHRGEALLREAIDVLAGPDTRLEHARALADLGAHLRRATTESRRANFSAKRSTPPTTSAPNPSP